MQSSSAINDSPQWAEALSAIGLADGDTAPAPDLGLLFVSPAYDAVEDLVVHAYRRSAASVLVGCSGGGVVGTAREIEQKPALSMLNLAMPGAQLTPVHLEMEDLRGLHTAQDWRAFLGLAPEQVNAWVLLVDPFTFQPDALVEGLSAAYPGVTIAGGLASGVGGEPGTLLFVNEHVYTSGAVALAIGGAYTVLSVVAQGAAPIGEPWTITEAQGNVLRTIGNRPPLDVLRDTLNALTEDMQKRAARNLLVGLAMDEYRDRFGQGDFLIRNLLGVDRGSGAIAIGAEPVPGQTIQFQVRDAAAADEDLRRHLSTARQDIEGVDVAGAMLCTCNGRGVGLFGNPDHDAKAIADELGPLPLAGFFCNGEIGPVGPRTYVHGFTASLALFVPVDQLKHVQEAT